MRRSIVAPLVSTALAASGYQRVQKIAIGGEGGWDYLKAGGAGRSPSHFSRCHNKMMGTDGCG